MACNREGLELELESPSGTAGGVRERAEQTSDPGIAFSDSPGSALAGRLVVTRAETHPGGEAIDRAEGTHVVADPDR